MIRIISIAVSVIAFSGCAEDDTSLYSSCSDSAAEDTPQKWQDYFQSSSEGLWEDSSQYALSITRVHAFGGEDELNPVFFKPGLVHVMGDTLLITDEATQSLV